MNEFKNSKGEIIKIGDEVVYSMPVYSRSDKEWHRGTIVRFDADGGNVMAVFNVMDRPLDRVNGSRRTVQYERRRNAKCCYIPKW